MQQQQQQQQAQMEKRRVKPSLAAGLATSTVAPELVIEDKGTLPHMCKKYSGLSAGLMEQPFQFCEPGSFSAAHKELDTRMTGGR